MTNNGELYPGGYTVKEKGYLYSGASGWQRNGDILKFSMNTIDEAGNNLCYRLQLWYYNQSSLKGFNPPSKSDTNVKAMDVDFGRSVRAVVF